MDIKLIKGGITAPAGFLSAGVHCGLKKNKQLDLGLIVSKVPAIAVATFTTNRIKGAPLIICKKHIKNKIRAIVINTKYANTCTAKKGLEDANNMCSITASELGIKPTEVLVASTGIIGQFLPMSKIQTGIKKAVIELSSKNSRKTANAIMTTDTFPKEIAIELKIDKKSVHIAGIAKGAGMICPDMATMLAFLTTDVNIDKNFLDKIFKIGISKSFNMITVDGEMSTNDFACILANGLAGNRILNSNNRYSNIFIEGLEFVLTELAKMIAKDGEGATKFIEIIVKGAKTENQARIIGKKIANSNLVKTAIFGRDANWGRIMSAIGSSKEQIIPERISIKFGDILVAKNGMSNKFSETEVKKYLSGKNIIIEINLNMGYHQAKIWTCDLTDKYVYINANYRS